MRNNHIIGLLIIVIAVLLLNKNRENFENQTENRIAMSYVINLESDKDRFKILKKQLRHANLPYTRFEAILGKNVTKNDPLYKFYFSEQGKEKLKPTQMAVPESYLSGIKYLKEPKDNLYLIWKTMRLCRFHRRLNTLEQPLRMRRCFYWL